jgi:tetratricopeptide (TPR) repeat protein
MCWSKSGDLARRSRRAGIVAMAILGSAAALGAQEPTGSPASSLTSGPVKRAVLIGINDYAFLHDLRFCSRDTEALYARLIVSGFRPENVTLLRDGAEESRYQPFAGNIQRELNTLFDAAGPEDLVLVAFSGHGVQLGDTSYFCPLEAQLERPEGTLISLASVYERLQACKARQKLLVVDACRNDPYQGGTKGIDKPTVALDGFTRTLESPPEGILVFSSCKPGEVSFEDDDCRHGVFMNFVLQGLDGDADRAQDGNTNGAISLLELYNFASLGTKAFVARTRNSVQTPVLNGKVSGDYELATALPSRPDELPSRFHRMTGQGVDNILFTDPEVMTAKEPQTLLALRHAQELLLPRRTYGPSAAIPEADAAQALAAVNQAIALEPTNAFAYLLRAIAYRKRGDYAAALADYTRLNLPLEAHVGTSGEAELKIDDRVVGKVETLERLNITKLEGDFVWVDSIGSYTGRVNVDDKRQGWLHKQFLQPETVERSADADWRTSRVTGTEFAERTIGREQLKPVDAQDAKALDWLEQARDLLGASRGSGTVYLRHDLKADDLTRAIQLCDDALKIEPENESALVLRGIAHREKKDYNAALADYQRLNQSLPLVVRRSSVDLKQGNTSKGTARLGDTLTINKAQGGWLSVTAVNGETNRTGWVSVAALNREETFAPQAFHGSSSGSGRPVVDAVLGGRVPGIPSIPGVPGIPGIPSIPRPSIPRPSIPFLPF